MDNSEVVQGGEYVPTEDAREHDTAGLIQPGDVAVGFGGVSERAFQAAESIGCSRRLAGIVLAIGIVLTVVVVAIVAVVSETADSHFCHKEAEGSVWKECGSPCPRTCSDQHPICTKVCVARCECPPSKPLLLEGKCVAATDCSASDVQPSAISAAASSYWNAAGLIHGPGVGLQSHHVFRTKLQSVLKSHRVLTYGEDWKGLANVSYRRDCPPGSFYGVYSGYCWKTGKAAQGGNECGIYHHEGTCWNREHIWPKSWFGGFDAGHGAQTDLHELWAADGYVNGRRRNCQFTRQLSSQDSQTLRTLTTYLRILTNVMQTSLLPYEFIHFSGDVGQIHFARCAMTSPLPTRRRLETGWGSASRRAQGVILAGASKSTRH